MAKLDSRSRELLCKVVFGGPKDAGVGTTFRELWSLIPDAAGSALIPGADDPPLYNLRYRPEPSIRLRGMKLSLDLWGYEAEPRGHEFEQVLRGADAVVIVLDSDPRAMVANQQAFADFGAALTSVGTSLDDLSVLIQYNKRDLKDAVPIPLLEARFNDRSWAFVATAASMAQGLTDLLDRLASEAVRSPSLSRVTTAPPTPSMTSAFARAERKLFGPGEARESEDDRTVLSGMGSGPSAPAPAPVQVIPTAPPPGTDREATRDDETSGDEAAVSDDSVAADEPVPQVATRVVDIEVPELSGYEVIRLGTPELLNARWLALPMEAETQSSGLGKEDGARVEVELRIKLGGKARPAPPGEPQARALQREGSGVMGPQVPYRAQPEPPQRMIPTSWIVFGAVLLAVVVAAYVLGTLLQTG